MAAVIPFDTLAYARKLESAGVAKPQAEAQATALADAFRQAVASPDDLKTVELNLGSKIAAVEWRLDLVEARIDAKIDAKFDKLAAILDTQRWVLGLQMA
jgi:acetyl-CoA acetyltransferase